MAKKRQPPKKLPAKTLAIPRIGTPTPADPRLDTLYRQVREILTAARNRAWEAVNTAMVGAYWEVGRVIVEDEQSGKEGPTMASGSCKDSPSGSRRNSTRASTLPTSATCGRFS